MNNITAFIPARGGSKGIPGKNIKTFAGKPLIVHSIEYALNCTQIDEVVVSTDDDKISEIARKARAKVVIRPPELSIDSATTESDIHNFVNKSIRFRKFIKIAINANTFVNKSINKNKQN